MLDREAIVPLLLGAVFAIVVNVAAAAAFVRLQTVEHDPQARGPDPAERAEREREAEPLPNLVAEQIEVSEPRIAGRPATIRTRIVNVGDVAAEPFGWSLAIGRGEEAMLLVDERRDEPLAPGEAIEWELEHTVAEAGAYAITLHADGGEELADADPASKRLREMYLWQLAPEDRPDGVDLAATELRIGRPRVVGVPVTVSGRVVNLGRSDAGVFNVVLRVNGEAVEEVTVDGLASGASERIVRRIYVDEPGEHEVTLEADPAGAVDDIDRSKMVTRRVAEWKAEDELDHPPIGQREPSPLAINWISYEDFEDLLARQEEFDQAAVQREVEPTPDAPTPTDPTPPAPPQVDQQTSPPPAPELAVEQLLPDVPELDETAVQPPTQPTVPAEAADADISTAPSLEVEAEMAAAPLEGEAALPEPPDLVELEADTTEPVTDPVEAEEPVAAVPDEAFDAPEVAIATPDLPLEAEGDILLPEVTEQPAEEMAERQAPEAEIHPDADPADRSLQVQVEEFLREDELSLPLESDAEADAGSPQEEATDAEASDRVTETADLPVDPSEPLRDASPPREDQPQETAESPAEQDPAEQQVAEEADPTSAPRDERESPPVSRLDDARVVPGRVIARQGIEVRTVEPRFSHVTRRTTLPRDPEVVLTFNARGEVVHARFLRATGYANVDAPILASLYRWSAHGEGLAEVEETFVMRVQMLLGANPNAAEEEEGEE